jgi:hypothetical protein
MNHKKIKKMYYRLRHENATGAVTLWLKEPKKPTERELTEMLAEMVDRDVEQGSLTDLEVIMKEYLDWAEPPTFRITEEIMQKMEDDLEDELGYRDWLAQEVLHNTVQGNHLLRAIQDEDCQPTLVTDIDPEEMEDIDPEDEDYQEPIPEEDDEERLERTFTMFIMEDL